MRDIPTWHSFGGWTMSAMARFLAAASLVVLCTASAAVAQVQTGSITGAVTDISGGVMPGASVSLSGDKLIGGVQTQVTDATGAYRFDRLPPGGYQLKFELQGFKTISRTDIVVNASFVATVNAKLEVGNVSETITVTGESPTVDTKSNLQQTVLTQELLEGVPSGRVRGPSPSSFQASPYPPTTSVAHSRTSRAVFRHTDRARAT
jgi:opacity protein-like surface antigen